MKNNTKTLNMPQMRQTQLDMVIKQIGELEDRVQCC